jgi:L-threonylcarbamoyladenylate synthase
MIENTLEIYIELAKYNTTRMQVKAPGTLESHYSPKAKVYLSGTATKGDGFIALSKFPTPREAIRLASPTNNNEFAQQIYEAFRVADFKGIKRIFVVPPVGNDIAEAINDRLQKSSS